MNLFFVKEEKNLRKGLDTVFKKPIPKFVGRDLILYHL